MNEELNKTIKEFYIKQQKLLNEMTNYSKSQLISIIEREMNENHYLRNEIDRLKNIINELEEYTTENIEVLENRLNSPFCNFEKVTKELLIFQNYLDKLKELKENNKDV